MKRYSAKIIIFFLAAFVGLIGYWYYSALSTPPTIQFTSPANQETFVLNTKTLTLTFKTPVKNLQKKRLALASNPDLEFDHNWLDDQTLKSIPKSGFSVNSDYQITVLYQNQPIHQFSFSTNLYTDAELNSQAGEQIQSDYDYAQARLNFFQSHPWKLALPLREEGYTVSYDETTPTFRLIVPTAPSPQIIEEYKATATLKLLNLGVTPDQIVFQVIDLSKIITD